MCRKTHPRAFKTRTFGAFWANRRWINEDVTSRGAGLGGVGAGFFFGGGGGGCGGWFGVGGWRCGGGGGGEASLLRAKAAEAEEERGTAAGLSAPLLG